MSISLANFREIEALAIEIDCYSYVLSKSISNPQKYIEKKMNKRQRDLPERNNAVEIAEKIRVFKELMKLMDCK